MYKNDVLKYFKKKAPEYDLVEEQGYWRLSDKLLWHAITTYIIPLLPQKFNFCDAGGGTGRWSLKLLEHYPLSAGYTLDFSEAMLNEAEKKNKEKKLEDRWKCKIEDLSDLSDFSKKEKDFDFVFNFHNVIGFMNDISNFFQQLIKITKRGGIICTLAPNAYHGTFFNIMNHNIADAKKSLQGLGRFTTQMPYIKMFTPQTIKEVMEANGIEIKICTGFPNFIYPGYQETQLHGQTESIADILKDEDIFNQIYQLEVSSLENKDIAARGNNIFIFGVKK